MCARTHRIQGGENESDRRRRGRDDRARRCALRGEISLFFFDFRLSLVRVCLCEGERERVISTRMAYSRLNKVLFVNIFDMFENKCL